MGDEKFLLDLYRAESLRRIASNHAPNPINNSAVVGSGAATCEPPPPGSAFPKRARHSS
jgi:hypothetical protein